jgi:hypothetical protein
MAHVQGRHAHTEKYATSFLGCAGCRRKTRRRAAVTEEYEAGKTEEDGEEEEAVEVVG